MQILLAGGSGLIGTALQKQLLETGHDVELLRRGADGWDLNREFPEAVIHLGGVNIASKRWTARFQQQIRDSRVHSTEQLAQAMANQTQNRPKTLIVASAVGLYGHRGDEPLTEQATPGKSFLSQTGQQWEQAANPARQVGIRVIHARFGMVLSKQGGALSKMLLPFKLCLGGVVGSGKQYWPWISLKDATGAVEFALENESITGPMNVVSPQTVTCYEFTKALGQVLHRPTVLPMPAMAARLALGPMADELLLASTRAVPQKLIEAGYVFSHQSLSQALRYAVSV